MRWLCGGLHQIITFSFSRNTGYFCFLLSPRPAPPPLTAYITDSLDRTLLTSSRTPKISSFLGVFFLKQSSSHVFLASDVIIWLIQGNIPQAAFIPLEDLHGNTLVSMLEQQQPIQRGVYILYIHKRECPGLKSRFWLSIHCHMAKCKGQALLKETTVTQSDRKQEVVLILCNKHAPPLGLCFAAFVSVCLCLAQPGTAFMSGYLGKG